VPYAPSQGQGTAIKASVRTVGAGFAPETITADSGDDHKGKSGKNAQDGSLQIVRTVAYVPGEGVPEDEGISGEAEGLDLEAENETEEGFGGGELGLLDMESESLVLAPSAGETMFGPEGEGDWGKGYSDPQAGDGPRVVKVIGYTPGSPLDKEILAGFWAKKGSPGLRPATWSSTSPPTARSCR
jgi:hypothetical protein